MIRSLRNIDCYGQSFHKIRKSISGCGLIPGESGSKDHSRYHSQEWPMRATTPTARASSPNQVSLFKEVAIKSQHIIPGFRLLPLAFTTSPKPVHSRELSKGTEGSSSLKNLEHVLIWMKCRQQEKRRDREGGERSTLETEEMRRIGSFSLFFCF